MLESEVDSLRSKLRQAKAALDDSEDQVAMLQSQLAKSRGSGSGARAITGRKKVKNKISLYLGIICSCYSLSHHLKLSLRKRPSSCATSNMRTDNHYIILRICA